jgi:cellobiose-specific phosphotransferase system component IIA
MAVGRGFGTGLMGAALIGRAISKRRNTKKAKLKRAIGKGKKKLSEAHKKAISQALKGRKR